MEAAPLDGTDLPRALEGRFPYHLLSVSLQQRLTQQEYHVHMVRHGALRWHAYHRLPDFVRATLTEAAYYEEMVRYGGERLQLYPYVYQRRILLFTGETPLSYYRRMLAQMLTAERSYDQLPNLTANDVLRLLGVGRNQYLDIAQEVRGRPRGFANRCDVSEYLPKELLPSVTLDPFWVILPVVQPLSQQAQQAERVNKLCRGHPEDAALYRLLAATAVSGAARPSTSGSSSDRRLLEALQVHPHTFAGDTVYVCQAPREVVERLHRSGLVCVDYTVWPEDRISVLPPSFFVMNRSSEEPLELLLYRVLSTVDDRTPLQLLAQLLMITEEDICLAAHALLRLGLAKRRTASVPEALVRNLASVHPSWKAVVDAHLAGEREQQGLGYRMASEPSRADTGDLLPDVDSCPADTQTPSSSGVVVSEVDDARGLSPPPPSLPPSLPPRKRIAFLYDATLTGFLMMTNLSRDPAFKQYAVTLFEMGKLPDELLGGFLELLGRIQPGDATGFGGEAQRYINSAVSLGELLRALRAVCPLGSDVPSGVDMLKIESLNELEATTRYSVLGRNYWMYITTAPIATPPFIDVELNCVYGSTASLVASPWLLLYYYEKAREGPPTLVVPLGSRLQSWPPAFLRVQEAPEPEGAAASGAAVVGYAAKVRVQAIALDAEVLYADMDSALLLVNEMASAAPVVVQCVAAVPLTSCPPPQRSQRGEGGGVVVEHPDHGYMEVTLPFAATEEEVQQLLLCRAAGVLRGEGGDLALVPSEGEGSGAARDSRAAAESCGVALQDGGALVCKALRTCVDTLRLRDSLGYLTCCVSFHLERHAASASASAYVVDGVSVVGLGLGIPLTHRECCACAVASLPRLLSGEAMERHDAAVRVCVEEFSCFLERYSSLTRAEYGKLPLRSTGLPGSITQQHLRKAGSDGATPLPAMTLVFTGSTVQVVDDANPLSEEWPA